MLAGFRLWQIDHPVELRSVTMRGAFRQVRRVQQPKTQLRRPAALPMPGDGSVFVAGSR